MLLIAAEVERVLARLLERLAQINDRAVHAGADETLGLQLFEDVAVVTLLAAHQRGEKHQPRPLRHGHDRIDDLRGAGALDDAVARGRGAIRAVPAAWRAAAREEQSQVVVDLRRGGDGGSRVVSAGALLDRDGRGQALDRLDVGLLKLVEELPGIRRERLHVLALTFSEDRVKGERRFARAGEAGDDDELIARNVHVDAAQIVLARSADADHVQWAGLSHEGW